MFRLFTYLIISCCYFLSFFAQAASNEQQRILAIVSDRSAPSLVAGAHHFLKANSLRTNSLEKNSSDTSIVIRSVSQINQLTNAQLQTLINQQQNVIVAAVFGETVDRLLALTYSTQQTRLVINADRRLMVLHNDKLKGDFSALSQDQYKALMIRLDKNDYTNALSKHQQTWPKFVGWLQARGYWKNRGRENLSHLFTWILSLNANDMTVSNAPKMLPLQPIRFYWQQQLISLKQLKKNIVSSVNKPVLFMVDHDSGDQPGQWELHQQMCSTKWHCVSVLAGWGSASQQAIASIREINALLKTRNQSMSILALQDFVIGGGEGRSAVTQAFIELNVPVFKGIRVTEQNKAQYDISTVGLPSDSVHYRIAMPELQGTSQAHILAIASSEKEDALTGAILTTSEPVTTEIKRMKSRINKWFSLNQSDNSEKKIAIVYYNHPPGRHNIGADNLNVPRSLWQILTRLRDEGYDLGDANEFPKSSDALLDLLQQKAVNLPQDKGALKAMSGLINTMPATQYQDYFSSLPSIVQAEMVDGPVGFLHQRMNQYLTGEGRKSLLAMSPAEQKGLLDNLSVNITTTYADLHHAVDGIRHKGRVRALDLLSQLEKKYLAMVEQQRLTLNVDDILWQQAAELKQALIDMRIEGIRGWGKAPGLTMVWNNELLLPGVQFGNVFLGPQPPRGWEINEELLHANMTFPPPHQYLAFYHYLRDVFDANAIIHLGRHSTYEFLPKRATGLTASDYPSLIIDDVPSIYPYIVDGVGEGIQAKRRGMAVMLDHLTPPLATTELYDGLLQLRQLIESAEAAVDESTQKKAIKALRHKIDVLNLRDELIASMDEELEVRGVGFSDVDDEFLLHEVGHYLTKLQEEFMPLGLHVYGKRWKSDAISTMMESIEKGEVNIDDDKLSFIKQNLIKSPQAEMDALVNVLNGGFVAPGKGNDPIRTPDVLPTGRNFYALNGSLIPSELGFSIGQQLAKKSRDKNIVTAENHKEAVILWASDAVRDEGAMIAFGMDMLGVTPVWNRRGILKSLSLVPLDKTRVARRDMLFTTSGLFRDLYAQQLDWLDRSVLLALAASKKTIEKQYPALSTMLASALSPIDAMLALQTHPLNESLDQNMVAKNWVNEAQILLRQNPSMSIDLLGRQASYRIFGTAPGAYGAGINRLAERSGSWTERKQLGEAYIKRMSHAYGVSNDKLKQGSNAQALFRSQLSQVENTYLGRASNLYGLIDNNDAYDYLGGLNLAIETLTNKQPNSFVISHANSNKLSIEPLQVALLSELRGRFLNRQWIEPLMTQGYAGARTMGSEFIENLWGWQATSPHIIRSWVWEDLKSVYIDDSLNLGLDTFLSEGHNVQVQSNILAIMLVAIDKGFWETDQETKQQLAQQFADNIIKHGIPGSGHTHANHPIYQFIKPMLSTEQSQKLAKVLAAANHTPAAQPQSNIEHIQELTLEPTNNDNEKSSDAEDELSKSDDVSKSQESADKSSEESSNELLIMIILLSLMMILIGFGRSFMATRTHQKQDKS